MENLERNGGESKLACSSYFCIPRETTVHKEQITVSFLEPRHTLHTHSPASQVHNRVVAVFGLPSCSTPHPPESAHRSAINDKIMHELTTLPSSQWVSDEKANEWGGSGAGRRDDGWLGAHWERRVLNGYRAGRRTEAVSRDASKRGKHNELPDMVFLEDWGTHVSTLPYKMRVEAEIKTVAVDSCTQSLPLVARL